MTVAELLVLALRVLPGEIRGWLKAERNLSEEKKEGASTPESVRPERGSG